MTVDSVLLSLKVCMNLILGGWCILFLLYIFLRDNFGFFQKKKILGENLQKLVDSLAESVSDESFHTVQTPKDSVELVTDIRMIQLIRHLKDKHQLWLLKNIKQDRVLCANYSMVYDVCSLQDHSLHVPIAATILDPKRIQELLIDGDGE